MKHWGPQHRVFVVETFFKNGESITVTQRKFHLHFNVARHGRIPSRNTILLWVHNLRTTASAMNYGGCFLGSSSPTEVMCRAPPPALRTCHPAISFCGGTSKEKCTSTSHEIFLSCRMQLSGKCAPYLAECEQVMTNFSPRLNVCVQNKGRHLNDVIFHV